MDDATVEKDPLNNIKTSDKSQFSVYSNRTNEEKKCSLHVVTQHTHDQSAVDVNYFPFVTQFAIDKIQESGYFLSIF